MSGTGSREPGTAQLAFVLGGGGARATGPEPKLPDMAAWTDSERLGYERELLGFYVTGHPLGAVARTRHPMLSGIGSRFTSTRSIMGQMPAKP